MKTTELNKRIYKGTVVSIRQQEITAFGDRVYEVWFKSGKMLAYIHNSKRVVPFKREDRIEFTGTFIGKQFLIEELVDINDVNKATQEYYKTAEVGRSLLSQ